MDIALLIATNDTFDDCIAIAAQYFFDGSVAQARSNVGDFDDTETSFIIAYEGSEAVGTVTVRWNPRYPPFREAGIPFIQNIEIRYELRGKGYGSRVLAAVEQLIGARATKAGICVALHDDYGPAQRLYTKRGYIPDGRGACHGATPLRLGDTITLGHDHLLWLVKDLREEVERLRAQG